MAIFISFIVSLHSIPQVGLSSMDLTLPSLAIINHPKWLLSPCPKKISITYKLLMFPPPPPPSPILSRCRVGEIDSIQSFHAIINHKKLKSMITAAPLLHITQPCNHNIKKRKIKPSLEASLAVAYAPELSLWIPPWLPCWQCPDIG